MDISLIAFDLDGTLFARNEIIDDYTKRVLEKAKDQGYKLAIISGRNLFQIRRLLKDNNADHLFDYILGGNSAQILDVKTGETFTRLPLEKEQLDKAMPPLFYPASWWLCSEDTIYVSRPDLLAWMFAKKQKSSFRILSRKKIKQMAFDRLQMVSFPGLVSKLASKIGSSVFSVSCMPWLLEIFNKDLNKGCGIAWLAEREGIHKKQILAFGDDLNDLEMLKTASGVAMPDGKEEAIQAAEYICNFPHDKQGAAKFIETNLFKVRD